MSALFRAREVEVQRLRNTSNCKLYALGVHVGWLMLNRSTPGAEVARHVRARGNDPSTLAVLREWLRLYDQRLAQEAERVAEKAAARDLIEAQAMREALHEARKSQDTIPN